MVAKEELSNSESKNANGAKTILLNNIKNQFFENGDKINLTLYVKAVNDAHVVFDESVVSFVFKTTDSGFLKQHSTEDSTTLFKWDIQLDGRINHEECTYKIKASSVEFILSKHSSMKTKWNNVVKVLEQTKQQNIPNDIKDAAESKKTNESVIQTEQESKSKNIPSSKKYTKITTSKSRSASSSLSPSPPSKHTVYDSSNRKSTQLASNHQYLNSNYGFVGLANLGNTCYMNAALQCLVNTTDLRDFFLETPSLLKKELNTNNSLGLNGRLAISFAILLKQIWQGGTSYVAPNQLRDLICSKYAHFRGYEQQDTHEFLCSLLSILHEDLNRVLKKPFYESGLECEDETLSKEFKVANESWDRFLSRENSVIVDNFYGQFKSKLICPECNKVSITFEPFNSILVPLPSPKVAVNLVLMFNPILRQRQPIKTTLYLSGNETIQGLTEEMKNKYTELKNSTLLAFVLNRKIYENEQETGLNECGYKFDNNWTCLSPKSKLISPEANNLLILYETENSHEIKEPILELRVNQTCKYPLVKSPMDKCTFCHKPNQTESSSTGSTNSNLRRCTRCFKAAYCNNDCQKNDWKHHSSTVCNLDYVGLPFVFTIRKSQTNSMNTESVLKKLFIQMSTHTVETEKIDENNETNFELELDADANSNKLKPISMSNISEILENLNNTNGSNKLSHIILKLQMKWKNLKGFEVNTTFKKITDQTPLGNSNELLSLNLNDCLKLFTQPEKLTSDNPWYCSKCKKHQEATKQMSLWKLPKYLIITLKRFQATKASDSFGLVNSNLNYLLQNRVVYNKLSTHIDFPLRNLDMSKYVKESNMAQYESDQINFNYDLCGVINHLGQSLYLGHYTAFTRTHHRQDTTQDEIGWRLFDDSKSMSVKNPEQVVTRDAYVLMYRLQSNATKVREEKVKIPTDEKYTEAKTSKSPDSVDSDDENSEESEQFNSANQSSDDNISIYDSDEKSRPNNYTNLNDID